MTKLVRSPAIEALFAPHDVRAFSATVDESFSAALHADEAPLVETMAPGRKAEFATARACARAALSDFGAIGPVGRSRNGAPHWPAGAVGSISHTRGYCVAIAAAASTGLTIGIDVETLERVSPAIERRVLVPGEREQRALLDGDARRHFVATVFAAKEAFYKAQYPRTEKYLGFDAVLVRQRDDGSIGFEPASEAADPELVAAATGARLYEEGRVIVGVSIGRGGR